jgi:hypothetical protein
MQRGFSMDIQTKVLLFSAIAQCCVGVISVIAIFMAPMIALNAQQKKESARAVLKRKHDLFATLMTYRATRLAPRFVEALNSIDLAFSSDSNEDRLIRDAWTSLLDHFTNDKGKPDFGEKSEVLTTALLSRISGALGFEFNEVYLKRHSYYPQLHSSMEEEQNELRRLLLELLRTNRRLPVSVFEEKFPDLPIHTKKR